MDDLKLKAVKREVIGKKNKVLRRQGITPVHLFGHDVASQALQCDTAKLKRLIAQAGATRLITLTVDDDKEPKNVFIREVQRDVFGKQLLHVDFYQPKRGEKMTCAIPIVLVGEAPAMRGKGRMLTRGITILNIECLPENVPPQIEVDISQLQELEQPIQVKDLALGPDITVHADPDQLLVKVTEIVVKEVEEVVAAAVPEGEAVPGAEGEAKEEGEKPSAESAPEKPEK